MNEFNGWLDTFIDEKGVDKDHLFEIEQEGEVHFLEMGVLLDFIKKCPVNIRESIKTTIVKIDFKNGDIMHFFDYLAKGYILQYNSQR